MAWPLVQHAHAPANSQADARSVPSSARFVEVVACIEHQLYPQAVPAPLLLSARVVAAKSPRARRKRRESSLRCKLTVASA